MVILAGQKVTADELNALGEITVTIKKQTDEPTSSTTFTDDDELLFSGLDPGTYELVGQIWYSGGSGDIQIRWSWPAGSGGTKTWAGWGQHTDYADSFGDRDFMGSGDLEITTSPTSAVGYGNLASARPINVQGRMTTQTSGTLRLQFALHSAAGTTTVKAGSWLTLRKVA